MGKKVIGKKRWKNRKQRRKEEGRRRNGGMGRERLTKRGKENERMSRRKGVE